MSVITRIAPSPTGRMHIGTIRTALFNYLYAKKHGGTFLVRIEDTDRERSELEYEEAIWKDFSWCGLEADIRYKQSEHVEAHKRALEDMVARDVAYISKEPSQKDETQTVEVVRLRNPNKTITFNDEIRGDVSFETTELGDIVIARAIDDPLYHLAVVFDDHEAGVTHVLRAEEHISNTPRQILIQEALGYERPVYAHLPLILAPDRSKLSKRKHNAGIEVFRDEGYLPEAIINYLALLGWNPGTDQELFTLPELIEAFDLSQVQKGGAIFSVEKLNWFNKEHLGRKTPAERQAYLLEQLEDEALRSVLERSPAACRDILERIHTQAEFNIAVQAGEYDFYHQTPSYQKEALLWKKNPDATRTKDLLEQSSAILDTISKASWTRESIYATLWPLAEKEGKGEVLWPLRMALSGQDRSPDPFTILEALQKEESLTRLQSAISLLS